MEFRQKGKDMDIDYAKNIPVPACIVGSDGNICFANPLINNVFVYEDIVGSNFFALTGVRREALVKANEEAVWLERNEKLFQIKVNQNADVEDDILVYFEDATARERLKTRLENERPALAFINIDNYDELLASTTEDNKRVIPSQIDGIVRRWGDSFDSPVMSRGDDNYVMFTSRGKVDKMIEDNFSVLDEVRKIETQIDFPLSLSIGIGISKEAMSDCSDLAEAALELALGRGGDQTVVKTDDNTSYYGGTRMAVEKGNRGKARVISHAIKHLIEDADKVIIMGHRWPDMDSFGSAIGAYSMCEYMDKEAYIIINQYNDALNAIYSQAEVTENYNFIKSEKAYRLITDKTLLIIVDTNRPGLIEDYELACMCANKVIIDHHRITDDSIQNASVSYIESYASSAGELMAELLQHFAPKRFINKFEAEALLAGMMVDTNNFSGRTGVRTFEAAAWLKRSGADTTEVKRFFQMQKDDITAKAAAIAGADFSEEGYAFATTQGKTENTRVINAQVADELLMVRGVRASFALAQNEKGQTIISARSLGEINVQTIMEKLGGGGHFTSAAVQLDESVEDVEELLRRYIREYEEVEICR